MGLLSADLEVYRRSIKKVAAVKPHEEDVVLPGPVDHLKIAIELYAVADQGAEKTASDVDLKHLHSLHKGVESSYREAVKAGKKVETDQLLDKFSGWRWLKGAPGEPGDLHPLPAPVEK